MAFGIDDAIMIGSGLLGAAGGLFGGGGGGGQTRQSTNSSTNWNQTNTNSPWAGIQPYLMGMPEGETGPKGIYPEASRLYDASGWTPQMQDTSANWFNDLTNSRNIFRGNGFQNTGAAMVQGQFDPNITAAGPIIGAPIAEPPPERTLVTMRQGQGDLDPTKALQGFLNGDQSNPWIGQQQKAITDLATRNFNESILPGIRQTAIADGQYGGSRGDIANTLAVSRLNTDLAPALTQLASGAYENEQQRKFGVANALNDQAFNYDQSEQNRKLQRDTVNADNLIDVQKFNTGTTLNNNAQAMQAAAQEVANRGAGLNFATGAAALQDQNYTDMLKALGLPTDYNWGQLDRYNSIVSPAAAFQTTNGAGTSNTSGVTTGSQIGGGGNPIAGAIGGAAGGLGLARGLLGMGRTLFPPAGSGTLY